MKKFFTMPTAAAVLIAVLFVFARCGSDPASRQVQPAVEEAVTTAAQLAVSLKDGYAEVDVNGDGIGLGVLKVKGSTGVLDGIYHVDEGTIANPCAVTNNGSSIYFVVDGNEVLIIDGGNGGIDGYGFATWVDWYQNFQIIYDCFTNNGAKKTEIAITHSHGDHFGLLENYVSQNNGVPLLPLDTRVYITAPDYQQLAHNPFFPATWLTNYTDIVRLNGGETFGTTNYQLKVVWLRTHTPGSSAFVDVKKALAFTGDAIGSQFGAVGPTTVLYNDVLRLEKFLKDNGIYDSVELYPAHAYQEYFQYSPLRTPPKSGVIGSEGYALDKKYLEGVRRLIEAIGDGTAWTTHGTEILASQWFVFIDDYNTAFMQGSLDQDNDYYNLVQFGDDTDSYHTSYYPRLPTN
jgi:glyoxylase-like metal-dependent hydrolase (beta-lactamase superfamily II)